MVNKYEIAWTLAVVALLAGVAAYSAVVLYHIDALPEDPGEFVDVTGHQWYWEFCYSNLTVIPVADRSGTDLCFNSTYSPPAYGSGSLGTVSGGALWAAPGETVQINVTGADVIHSFNIDNLGVRIDAIPGRMNYFQFTVPVVPAGTEYLIQCTEFCGAGHGTMRSFLIVT